MYLKFHGKSEVRYIYNTRIPTSEGCPPPKKNHLIFAWNPKQPIFPCLFQLDDSKSLPSLKLTVRSQAPKGN